MHAETQKKRAPDGTRQYWWCFQVETARGPSESGYLISAHEGQDRNQHGLVVNIPIMPYYLVGGLEHVLFFHILRMSSSQLTKSIIFQRGRAQQISYRFKTFQNSDQISSNGFGEHDPSVSPVAQGAFWLRISIRGTGNQLHGLLENPPFTVDKFPVKQSK